jgi:pimeloyl-ACP methyl ester carboxylesterase
MEPRRHDLKSHDGYDLCVFEWPGDGPPVFFAHATGFHARCWDQVVAKLHGRQCYAIDFRGHGRSAKPEPPYVWRHFGEDVVAVAEQLGLEGSLGVGHSKGGHAVTFAAAHRPEAFAGLLLLDPVIMTEAAYQEFRPPAPGGEHFAARRRNEWSSPEEMFERFTDREPFVRWDVAVLRDYCDYGLLPDGDGYVLACPPAIEADVYANAGGTNIYPEVALVDVPVRVLRGKPREMMPGEMPRDMSASPTARDLASHFTNAEDVLMPEATHFFPMEDPGLVARHIEEMLATMAS